MYSGAGRQAKRKRRAEAFENGPAPPPSPQATTRRASRDSMKRVRRTGSFDSQEATGPAVSIAQASPVRLDLGQRIQEGPLTLSPTHYEERTGEQLGSHARLLDGLAGIRKANGEVRQRTGGMETRSQSQRQAQRVWNQQTFALARQPNREEALFQRTRTPWHPRIRPEFTLPHTGDAVPRSSPWAAMGYGIYKGTTLSHGSVKRGHAFPGAAKRTRYTAGTVPVPLQNKAARQSKAAADSTASRRKNEQAAAARTGATNTGGTMRRKSNRGRSPAGPPRPSNPLPVSAPTPPDVRRAEINVSMLSTGRPQAFKTSTRKPRGAVPSANEPRDAMPPTDKPQVAIPATGTPRASKPALVKSRPARLSTDNPRRVRFTPSTTSPPVRRPKRRSARHRLNEETQNNEGRQINIDGGQISIDGAQINVDGRQINNNDRQEDDQATDNMDLETVDAAPGTMGSPSGGPNPTLDRLPRFPGPRSPPFWRSAQYFVHEPPNGEPHHDNNLRVRAEWIISILDKQADLKGIRDMNLTDVLEVEWVKLKGAEEGNVEFKLGRRILKWFQEEKKKREDQARKEIGGLFAKSGETATWMRKWNQHKEKSNDLNPRVGPSNQFLPPKGATDGVNVFGEDDNDAGIIMRSGSVTAGKSPARGPPSSPTGTVRFADEESLDLDSISIAGSEPLVRKPPTWSKLGIHISEPITAPKSEDSEL